MPYFKDQQNKVHFLESLSHAHLLPAGAEEISEEVAAALSNPPKSLPEIKAELVTAVDNSVASIYQRFTRFESEYTLRESQAQAFKDANYTGTVPEQVAAFATPAGMTPEAATDLILSQAANLRGALSLLGVKRMRKYEVINAADAAAAQAKFDEISAEIKAIGDSLS